MRTLGEEIAVLDGLDDLGTLDGQSGYRSRVNVLDPTEGANYTGGSDWSPGMPLVMSNAGLADADLAAFAVQTGMPRPAGEQRPRFNVLDPSEGADYTGGSNWTAGMPLVLSNAGLAEDRYSDGTYDGMPLSADFDEHYGSTMDTLEGNFSSRVNVLDPTEGANYTGGSDWTPGMPLVMSNAGLAGVLLGRTAQMPAIELQQILAAAGAKITVNGVWDTSSVRAVKSWAEKVEGAAVTSRELNQNIRPYAGGKMVLVNTVLLSKTMEKISPSSLGGLASFDAVPDTVLRALSNRVVSVPRAAGVVRGAGQSPLRQARRKVDAAVSSMTRPGVTAAQWATFKMQLDGSLKELAKIRAARGVIVQKASPNMARGMIRNAERSPVAQAIRALGRRTA